MSIHPIANYNDTSIKYTGNDNKKEIKEEAAPINNGDAAVYEKTVDSSLVTLHVTILGSGVILLD